MSTETTTAPRFTATVSQDPGTADITCTVYEFGRGYGPCLTFVVPDLAFDTLDATLAAKGWPVTGDGWKLHHGSNGMSLETAVTER